VDGREPVKDAYYSPRIIWFLAILVAVALLVVGLTICSDDELFDKDEPISQSLSTALDSSRSNNTPPDTLRLPADTMPKSDTLHWLSFDEAMAELAGTNRFAMLYFSADSCPPCRQLEKEIFSDSLIIGQLRFSVLPVMISASSDRNLTYAGRRIAESGAAALFNIPGFPSLLFYDSHTDKFLFTLSGHIDPVRLLGVFQYLNERAFEIDTLTLEKYLAARAKSN